MKLSDRRFYPWMVVGLLWVVALLNYMDRQMLSTMQQSIRHVYSRSEGSCEFRPSHKLAIFLWIYGCISPAAGAVADRLSRKWIIVGSLGVWAL